MAAVKRKLSETGSCLDPALHNDYEIKRRQIDAFSDDTIPDSVTPLSELRDEDFYDDDNDACSTRATSPEPSIATTVATTTSQIKSLRCDYPGCTKAYNRPVRLAEHQRSHTGERPFVCHHEGCTKTFARRSHMKHHLNTQHEQIRNFVCDFPSCEKAYSTGQRLRVHQKKAHEEQKPIYRCSGYPPCDQEFRKPETLNRHVTSVHLHDKPYTCDATINSVPCVRSFKTSYALLQHHEREHSGDRFWCEQCPSQTQDPRGLGFATQTQLQAHTKATHRPTCPECGFTAQTASALRAHTDIAHTSLDSRRVVPCMDSMCDRAFTSKGNMSIHFRSAHEAKRYVCGAVDFSAQQQMTTATSTTSTTTTNSSAATPAWDGVGACGRAFVSKQSLCKHIRAQHLLLPPAAAAPGKARRRARRRQEAGRDTNPNPDPDPTASASASASVAGLLTGADYATTRHLACAVQTCAQRFRRVRDLEVHLEMTHGFGRRAAAEAGLEQEALCGGVFWVGDDDGNGDDAVERDGLGYGNDDDNDNDDDDDGDDDALREDTLAARLEEALGRDAVME